MSDYHWTDAALYELVKDLPDDARPKGVVFYDQNGNCPSTSRLPAAETYSDLEAGHERIPIAHAVALHEASALRWLGRVRDYGGSAHGVRVQEVPWDDLWRCTLMGEPHYGHTLLHALVAAIRSSGAGGGDSEGGAG